MSQQFCISDLTNTDMDGRIKNVEIVKDCAHYDDVLDDDIGFREKAGVTHNKTCSG